MTEPCGTSSHIQLFPSNRKNWKNSVLCCPCIIYFYIPASFVLRHERRSTRWQSKISCLYLQYFAPQVSLRLVLSHSDRQQEERKILATLRWVFPFPRKADRFRKVNNEDKTQFAAVAIQDRQSSGWTTEHTPLRNRLITQIQSLITRKAKIDAERS